MLSTKKDIMYLLTKSSGPRVSAITISTLLVLQTFYFTWDLKAIITTIGIFSSWGIIEWATHRYLMHGETIPIINKKIPSPFVETHKKHHMNPTPPEQVLFGGGSLFVLYMAIFIAIGLTFSCSYATAAVIPIATRLILYDILHAISHSEITPNNFLIRDLVKNHREHHYRDNTTCYGVTSLLSDRLFDTK